MKISGSFPALAVDQAESPQYFRDWFLSYSAISVEWSELL